MKLGDADKKAFFLHTMITHSPHIFEKDGTYNKNAGSYATGEYAFDVMSRIVKNLKKLDIYDNTLILFIADHGSQQLRDKTCGGLYKNFAPIFNPLLLIKVPNATQEFRENKTTLWNGEIAYAMREFLGIEESQPRISETPFSLLSGQESVERKVNIPLFFKPWNIKTGTPLSEWKKVNFVGQFRDLDKVMEVDMNRYLVPKAKLAIYAGADPFIRLGLLNFSVNKRTVFNSYSPGALFVYHDGQKYYHTHCNPGKLEQTFATIENRINPQAPFFAIGMQVKKDDMIFIKKKLSKHFSKQALPKNTNRFNFIFCNDKATNGAPFFKISTDNLLWKAKKGFN